MQEQCTHIVFIPPQSWSFSLMVIYSNNDCGYELQHILIECEVNNVCCKCIEILRLILIIFFVDFYWRIVECGLAKSGVSPGGARFLFWHLKRWFLHTIDRITTKYECTIVSAWLALHVVCLIFNTIHWHSSWIGRWPICTYHWSYFSFA